MQAIKPVSARKAEIDQMLDLQKHWKEMVENFDELEDKFSYSYRRVYDDYRVRTLDQLQLLLK